MILCVDKAHQQTMTFLQHSIQHCYQRRHHQSHIQGQTQIHLTFHQKYSGKEIRLHLL